MNYFIILLCSLSLFFNGMAQASYTDNIVDDLGVPAARPYIISNLDFVSHEFTDVYDPNIPIALKDHIDAHLTDEELEKLVDKKLSIAIRYSKGPEYNQEKRKSRYRQRKLDENTLLKNGKSEFEIGMLNDNKKQPSVVGFVSLLFSDVDDGNDRGATHTAKIKYIKNLNPDTNVVFEFNSSLNTERIGDEFDCGDGTKNECQAQHFLAKTYMGGGFQKQNFDKETSTVTRLGVVGGVVERNAHKFNRFFDPANHQLIYHDFLNDNVGEGSADVYKNHGRKERYNLGGYLKLSAETTQNLIHTGGRFMMSMTGGGAVLLETNGAKRMDVWVSAGVTYQGKSANHGFEVHAGLGVHNRRKKTRLVEGQKFVPFRVFGDPVINDIVNEAWSASSYSEESDGFGIGLDCKFGFNYTYDRGHWRMKSGVTSRCGQKDMSRDYEDDGKLDLEYNTSLTITPGRKKESAIGKQLNEAIKKHFNKSN